MNVNRWREILQAPNEKKTKKQKREKKFIEKKSPSHRRRMKFCWEVRKETRLFIHFAEVTTRLKRSIEIERYFSKRSEGNVLDAWLPNKLVFFLWTWNYFHLPGKLAYVVMAFRNDKQRKRKFPWRLLIIKYHIQWEIPYRSYPVVWTLGKTVALR